MSVCTYYFPITEEEEKRLFEAMQDGYSAVGFKYTENKGLCMYDSVFTL